MVHKTKENFFDIRITGKSTVMAEDEIVDLIYEKLKDKAEFQVK